MEATSFFHTCSPTIKEKPSRTSNGCRISAVSSGRVTRSAPGSQTSSATPSTGCGGWPRKRGSRSGSGHSCRGSTKSPRRSRREVSIHDPMSQQVRDAMVPEPGALDGSASAQEAGERLSDPAVRAVFVCEDGRLTGVITRKTLVQKVVAPGRDPRTTPVREIAEPPLFTLDASMDLDEAFRALEEHDFERVPVVEGERLVGILSRTVLQRRLAEDEAPDETDSP